MNDQQIIQAARQYEPNNDALVESGDFEDTMTSLPVALAVLRQHGAPAGIIAAAERAASR
jgi:hypothetical protein